MAESLSVTEPGTSKISNTPYNSLCSSCVAQAGGGGGGAAAVHLVAGGAARGGQHAAARADTQAAAAGGRDRAARSRAVHRRRRVRHAAQVHQSRPLLRDLPLSLSDLWCSLLSSLSLVEMAQSPWRSVALAVSVALFSTQHPTLSLMMLSYLNAYLIELLRLQANVFPILTTLDCVKTHTSLSCAQHSTPLCLRSIPSIIEMHIVYRSKWIRKQKHYLFVKSI